MSANTQDLQFHRSPAQEWFMAMVQRTMDEGLSSRHGSKLSGQKPGRSDLDLNRRQLFMSIRVAISGCTATK